MPLDRRGILKGLGAGAVGGSAIFGSGALTQISSARTVSVNVTNDSSSMVSLSADGATDGIGTIEKSNGQLSFTLSNINADSQLVIGDAPSNDPASDTISDYAFTISDNLKSDALDSDEAIAVEVEVSGSGSASGLGLVFLPTDNTDNLANGATTGYTQSDQDSVAGANLQNRGTDIAAPPSRYDTENDSAKFLLDNESTVGAELILQADADDLNLSPSFDITITAQTVDAPAELTSSHIGMNVSQITGSSTATHELEVTNNYDSDVTAGISISEQGLSVSQSNVSIASLTTTTVEIDAAHLDTITPTVDATNDSTGNTVTAQQQVSVPGPISGGTESIRLDMGGTLYDVHAFKTTGSDTLSVDSTPSDGTVDVLAVGGGGGGGDGYAGGGGGAGGLVLEENKSITTGDVPVSVGAGGGVRDNGEDTSFGSDITAIGGGRGGGNYIAGSSGGSGGGGGAGGSGGSGTSGQGNAGGQGYRIDMNDVGGGGGGATQPGDAAAEDGSKGGDGGDGDDLSGMFGTEFGENGVFAGGGGGAVWEDSATPGTGGNGGGGDGAKSNAESGQANTGGGGGGADRAGSAGGSGVVLVRYAV